MKKIDPNFADFLKLLNSTGVKYLVVGGYAVAYHGFVRATGDLDIFVENSAQNAAHLIDVFEAFGFNRNELSEELFTEPGNVVRIGVPPLRLEVINKASGIEFSTCYAERIVTSIEGLEISFINRENLLVNKRAAARPKDLADIHELSGSSDQESKFS